METKVCMCCNQELPITSFNHDSSSADGRKEICKTCLSTEKKEQLSSSLAKFKARELIQELRDRGYKGTLTFTQQIKL